MKKTNKTGAAKAAKPASPFKEMIANKKNASIDAIAAAKEQSKIEEYIPDGVFENLPDLLKDSCDIFTDKHERDIYLIGALSVLGGCFHNVSAYNESDTKSISPNLMSIIVAPPASGKGVLKYAKKLATDVKKTFGERNLTSTEKEAMLMLPANISSAGLVQLVSESNGAGIMVESEIDTLVNANKQEWGNYSDLLRCSFSNESYSYYRKGNRESIDIDKVKLSMAISGTANQFCELIKSAENGLFSRGCYYIIENPSLVLKCHGRLNPKVSVEVDFAGFAKIVDDYYKLLMTKSEVKVSFPIKQLDIIQDKVKFEHDQVLSSLELGANVFRGYEIAQKIATILTCLRVCQKSQMKETLSCTDKDLETALILMKVFLRHSYKAYDLLPKINASGLSQYQLRLHAVLPETFSRTEAVELGKLIDIGVRTIDGALNKFKAKKLIEQTTHGNFQKIMPAC